MWGLAWEIVDRVLVEQTRIEYCCVPGAKGRKTSASQSQISLPHSLLREASKLLRTAVHSEQSALEESAMVSYASVEGVHNKVNFIKARKVDESDQEEEQGLQNTGVA